MTSLIANPYDNYPEHEFWEICVRRDLEAFLNADWSITEQDFDAGEFLGIDANGSHDPLNWTLKYPTLDSYRLEFAEQAAEFSLLEFSESPRNALYSLLTLSSPIIEGDRAIIVKTFDGELLLKDGAVKEFSWKSLFHLKNKNGRWRFTGFVGYLPLGSATNK